MKAPTFISTPVDVSPILYTALISLFRISCDKPKVADWESQNKPETQTPTVAPTPEITPTPTPQATPLTQASPQARLCPDGTLYVVKPFSITTEDGLHGFPVGKQVKVISNNGIDIVVTDGIKEASRSSEYFTNDMDKVDGLTVTVKRNAQTLQSQSVAIQSAESKQSADLNQERARNVLKATIKRHEEAMQAGTQQIKALKEEIDSLKSKYGTYSATAGWSFRPAYYSSPTKQRNEIAISQIEAQQKTTSSALQQLKKQLSEIK